MTNPEIEYLRLTSGQPGSIRGQVDDLESVVRSLRDVRRDIKDVSGVPVWQGAGALMFSSRATALQQGVHYTRSALDRATWALNSALDAYAGVETSADYYISYWRNRPDGLPPIIEEMFARVVNGRLVQVGRDYNEALVTIDSVLTGEDVDLDALDDETRDWVEAGLAKNEAWEGSFGSEFGPLIPNTAATGDDRGLIPQGLGYDAINRLLLQSYYHKNSDGDGDASYLAIIDEITGRETGEVKLGSSVREDGVVQDGKYFPTHAGGVTVDGNNVYVVDNGEIYTYDLREIRTASPGDEVPQSRPRQSGLKGGSYSAIKDGKLYMGDFENNKLYTYERNSKGEWEQVGDPVTTPDNCQGVVVRDNEFVFSSSSGRHENNSKLYIQDFDGNRSDPYYLPSMSQNVVEVNGELVITYESGAEEFENAIAGTAGWWWGRDDNQDLWPNPYMTRTPISELGLTGETSMEPATLHKAADEFEGPATSMFKSAGIVDGTVVSASALGDVPHAAVLAKRVNKLLGAAAGSLRTGSNAISVTGMLLVTTAKGHRRADEGTADNYRKQLPD